jgi:hypothetical protein
LGCVPANVLPMQPPVQPGPLGLRGLRRIPRRGRRPWRRDLGRPRQVRAVRTRNEVRHVRVAVALRQRRVRPVAIACPLAVRAQPLSLDLAGPPTCRTERHGGSMAPSRRLLLGAAPTRQAQASPSPCSAPASTSRSDRGRRRRHEPVPCGEDATDRGAAIACRRLRPNQAASAQGRLSRAEEIRHRRPLRGPRASHQMDRRREPDPSGARLLSRFDLSPATLGARTASSVAVSSWNCTQRPGVLRITSRPRMGPAAALRAHDSNDIERSSARPNSSTGIAGKWGSPAGRAPRQAATPGRRTIPLPTVVVSRIQHRP